MSADRASGPDAQPTTPSGIPAPAAVQTYRGQRLGLPASGPGSLAPTSTRLWAFLVDVFASALVAGLFVRVIDSHHSRLPGSWSLIPFAIDYIVGIMLAGRTLGMNLFGLRLIRVDRDEPVGLTRAVIRTALLMVFIPAVVFDRDNRGLQDRATDTAVVRS